MAEHENVRGYECNTEKSTALEKVTKNTSKRSTKLGLIPLRVDPRLFEYVPKDRKPDDNIEDQDTLRYELKITCIKNPQPSKSSLPEDLYKNSKAKLRPGHEIHAYMHVVKSIGRDHAKFSPVATAAFRLMPNIELFESIRNEDTDLLQKCFSPGVIEVVKQQTSSVTVESVGTLPPAVLFTEAVKLLKNKCRTFLAELNNPKKQ
ncbi:hypothetical protein HN011_008011 [Eciton burchellii]|nr:hypothetical protein HN011_008011 [Eciton burchellii]